MAVSRSMCFIGCSCLLSRPVATGGSRGQWAPIFFVIPLFLVPRKFFIKNIIRTNVLPPWKCILSPQNLTPGYGPAPQALKSVIIVVESLSKEMRTFGRICSHQSTSETINITLWRRKTKPVSVSYLAVVVLVTNKIYGAFPLRVSFVLWMLRSIMV